VPAHCDNQSQELNCQTADDESRPRDWVGKEHQRGHCEKESGWHDQQSSVFHVRSFLSYSVTGARPSGIEDGWQASLSKSAIYLNFSE
jgi:hypothetical protein